MMHTVTTVSRIIDNRASMAITSRTVSRAGMPITASDARQDANVYLSNQGVTLRS
jgi:hypothetical protein